MEHFQIVTVAAREPWTTVARGGNWHLVIEYHDGTWSCPVPELKDTLPAVGPDGRDQDGKASDAPVGLGYPLSGVPRGALIGRTVDEEGRPGPPFLVGRRRVIGPFPQANPDYFLVQLGPNTLNPRRARGALRVRLYRRSPQDENLPYSG